MIDAVIEAIAAKKEVAVSSIRPDTLLEDLELDSLDMIDLVFDIETALDVRLPQDLKSSDYAGLVAVTDLADFLKRHVSGKP